MMAGDWKLKNGNWKLEIVEPLASVCAHFALQFSISNFQFSISNAFNPARREASKCP